MLREIRCNICCSKKGKLIKKGVFGNPRQNIYKCETCGHVYLAPLLEDKDERKFYGNEYSDFLLARGDTKNINPVEHFKKNKPEAKRRIRDIKRFLSLKKSVLEIGSSSGFFISEIRGLVRQAVGIEPSGSHREFSLKKRLPAYSEISEVAGKKFDLIFMYYVLEHIKDPVNFLQSLRNLLKDASSMLIFEVPNVNEALVSLYKSPAYGAFVWQRAHYSYFSVEVLKRLLRKANFEAEFKPIQRYDISNHIHWLVEGKPGGAGKYSHVFSEALNNEYKKCLKKNWICDSVLTIAHPLSGKK